MKIVRPKIYPSSRIAVGLERRRVEIGSDALAAADTPNEILRSIRAALKVKVNSNPARREGESAAHPKPPGGNTDRAQKILEKLGIDAIASPVARVHALPEQLDWVG